MRTAHGGSYEQQMREFEASSNCFNAARNVNDSINGAVAGSMGCGEVRKPTWD